ncbi:MAG: Beta-mannosidase B [Sclerophora amabilis]|nr:MAG: Beta-mannosidase B [Sclerophora amabilis]
MESKLRSVVPLNEGWSFKQKDDPSGKFLPVAQFPTNVHLDLMANDLIPDPFFSKNELDVQWNSKAVIAFDGLDTYATVELNGQQILKTDNMFIPERVDVTGLLRTGGNGENEMIITFESAVLVGKKIPDKYPEHHWGCWNGDASRLAVRKAQYHYFTAEKGWDWGPMLMTCGPWRPICLEVYSARIADLYFTCEVDKSLKSAEVVVHTDVEGGASTVEFNISLNGRQVSSETVKIQDGRATAIFVTRNPELWYPAGYGSQPLYDLSATLFSENTRLDSANQRIGLRRAKLIQHKLIDSPGTSFFFEINNVPIFSGGSDWIPADSFISRISDERYRSWVKLAVEGNQVMLRVWGGGLFEQAAFYDACDEMGVLVWQDFLFACGNYPTYQEFLQSVKREATANVKLLRHHPSIVLWAGNNEDYQYQESENLDYDPSDKDPEHWLKSSFPARYIYEKLLVDLTKDLVPNTYYHFGSPWGGKDTRDSTVGDIHQWNVWHGTQERYQDWDKLGGRFVSEFGMEAFPNMKTIDSYLPKNSLDRYPQSSILDFHNKADGHERRLALYLVENIQYKFNPVEQYVYCTQLMQAECLSSAYRVWRRDWKGPGKEYCGGALVWQLNDCWPVTSWAIVDYYLRPKLAYFAVKREMKKISVGTKRTTHQIPADTHTRVNIKTEYKIEVWASSFWLDARTVDVQIKAWDLVSGAEIYNKTLNQGFVLEGNRSTEIAEFAIPVQQRTNDEEGQTVVAAYLFQDSQQVARSINWPDPLKYAHLQKPKHLQVKLSEDAKKLLVSAEVPVKGVAVEVEDDAVKFADNCIDIVPGESVEIAVEGLQEADEGKIGVRYLGL